MSSQKTQQKDKKDKYEHLRESRLRLTASRILILEAFYGECHPVDAESIFRKLHSGKLKSKLSKTTVYRTIDSLVDVGVVRRVDLRKDRIFYELTDSFSGNHHHHIVCTTCGRTEGFKQCDMNKTTANILKKSNFFEQINDHSLELFGMCKTCAKG